MSNYYVQLDGDYVGSDCGSGTMAEPFNSAAALDMFCSGQLAAQPVAGDSIYLRGTLDLARYYELDNVMVTSGEFQSGDVFGDSADPAQCSYLGRIARVINSTTWLAEVDENHSQFNIVYNHTRAGQALVLSDMHNPGIRCSLSGAAEEGFISLIGCDASWQPASDRVVFNGNSAAYRCLHLQGSNIRVENIHFTDAIYACVDAESGSDYHVLKNCEASNSSGPGGGLRLVASSCSMLIGCDVHHNSYFGGHLQRSTAINCSFRHNGRQGLLGEDLVTLINCLVHNNGSSGSYDGVYFAGGGCGCINCVVDSSSAVGVAMNSDAAGCCVIASRLTNNATFGVSQGGSVGGAICDYNLLCGNAISSYNGLAFGSDDIFNPATAGYSDRSGGDYTLTPDAPGRRINIEIGPATTSTTAAGLASESRLHDMRLSFPRHEVKFR